MSISGVSQLLTTAYQYENKNRKAATAAGFTEKPQDTKEATSINETKNIELFPGEVVVSQPPDYSGLRYNTSISNKSKEQMTLDEYKQWFMNEMSQMPVSTWYRSTCVGGSLVITEEAFKKMKSDPEWEATVTNMVREMYSVNGLLGSKMIGYQVIGASPEECYGEGIPADNSSGLKSVSKKEKSWWQKRNEKMKELLDEQAEKSREKAAEQVKLEQLEWRKDQLIRNQRLQDFLQAKTPTR